jgi:hypothetical protein
MFLISQVGNDPNADKFLDSLSGDTAIDRVLFRSSGTYCLAQERLMN